MEELDATRAQLIEKIKSVFPKNPSSKKGLKLADDPSSYYGIKLEEILRGKTWDEVVSHPDIIYFLSEVDCLREITDEAYVYYLPAFLVAVLVDPAGRWIHILTVCERIRQVLPKLTEEQIETLIEFFEVRAQIERNYYELSRKMWPPHRLDPAYDFEDVEDMQLRLMLYRDEMVRKRM